MPHKLWEEIKNIKFIHSNNGFINVKDHIEEHNLLYTVFMSFYNIFNSTDTTEIVEIFKYIEEIKKRKILVILITNTYFDSMLNYLEVLKTNFGVNFDNNPNVVFLSNIQNDLISTNEFINDINDDLYPSRNTLILDNSFNKLIFSPTEINCACPVLPNIATPWQP
jgi:hypothetical protein